ncbi:MAG: 2-dehydro-3-deoxy-6-phosphogalactonate aldolase [Pseudomonadota bacterium]
MNQRNIIAILRGISPGEAAEIGGSLLGAGISRIEVPLNSPEPLKSIEILSGIDGLEVGAGTVLTVQEVHDVCAAGGTYIVSPNADPDVIRATKDAGLGSYPGVFTATDCFAALNAGADALKIFPAFVLGPSGIKAVKAVLPGSTSLYAVGGVTEETLQSYRDAGCVGFGIGSNLYKPGVNAKDAATAARSFVAAYDTLS